MYFKSVLEVFFTHNQVKHYGIYNISNMQTSFKHNNIYKHIISNKT